MPSVSIANARLLSHCGVQQSFFDSLTVDGFFPRLPIQEIEGDCISWPIIRDADKPTVAYVTSGGPMSTAPVSYGTQGDLQLKRIAVQVQVARDLVASVSDVHPVAEDQALALAALVQEEVCRQLWAVTPSPNAPTGMFAFAAQNPSGTSLPAAGSGTPLTMRDLRCLREKVTPWLPSSPLCYVMNPKLYFQLHDLAQSYGAPLQYVEDRATGERGPTLDGVPIVASGHIALDEGDSNTSVFLARVGTSEKDPAKIGGVVRVHPQGRTAVDVGAFVPASSSPDLWIGEVSMDIAFANFSRTSVAALRGVRPL